MARDPAFERLIPLQRHAIDFYTDKLQRGEFFALPGYSDAEWLSLFGLREGHTTGLGQVITSHHGEKLDDVIARRWSDPHWYFAVPAAMWELPRFRLGLLDRWLVGNGYLIQMVERDIITDDLARDAGLYPLIHQVQNMNSVLIGPEGLGVTQDFLRWGYFYPIPSPNFHMQQDGIENLIEKMRGDSEKYAPGTVFLISAGVSAAVIIDRLYDLNPYHFYFDCGSIWDAFAGIGGQREWRAELYRDASKWKTWKDQNILGGTNDL